LGVIGEREIEELEESRLQQRKRRLAAGEKEVSSAIGGERGDWEKRNDLEHATKKREDWFFNKERGKWRRPVFEARGKKGLHNSRLKGQRPCHY